MNEEIKEILDKLSNDNFERDCNDGSCYKELYVSEIELLLDYITNLQQELNEYKFPNCKAKDIEVVRANLVDMMRKNKRLEQENEKLKEENKHIFANVNDDELLISNAMNYAEAQDYKSRCEKAIDKLGNYKHYSTPTEEQNRENEDIVDSAINILQNGDDK